MYKLLPNPLATDIWEIPSALDETWKIVAKSTDGYPVSLLIKKGKGFFWLLPWFGPDNMQVADFILRDISPCSSSREKSQKKLIGLIGKNMSFLRLSSSTGKKKKKRRYLKKK